MAQDLTAFDAVLKDVYSGPVRKQLNRKTNLLDLFTKKDVSKEEWEGRRVVLALHKSRNVGTKATVEGGLLPTAGAQGYENLEIPMRYYHGRIELSTQVIKSAKSNKGSFIRALESEQKLLVEDMARQRNRMLAYFGQGTLAVISSGVANATQTVKDAGGVVATGNPNPVRFLKPGMVVAFTDGTTIRGVSTINSVDAANNQITLSSSVTTTTGDFVQLGVTIGGTEQDSHNDEAMGVLGLVDSTTYVSTIHGLDRSQAANSFFRSQILSSVGALSPDILQRGIDNIEEVSGETIDTFICHSSARREVLKLAEADRRYFGGSDPRNFDAGTLAGQFKQDITYNGVPFRVDKDFAYGIIMGINKSHMYQYSLTDGEWADDDGAVLSRVANKDAFEAFYRVFENFASDKGNAHGRWDGVSVTVSSAVFSD